MTWVRQTDSSKTHTCHRPSSQSGRIGDLWRCDECHTLWRVADACDICDAYGRQPHPGQHAVGYGWRPATLWQRLRNRRNR